MTPSFQLLGWTAGELHVAKAAAGDWNWTAVDTGMRWTTIHNCSYAPAAGTLAIAAEEQGGRHLLGVYSLRNRSFEAVVSLQYILHQCIDQHGSEICFTQPSTLKGTADLMMYDVKLGSTRKLAESAAAQDTTPAFFPDQHRIAYHSPDRWIEVLDLPDGGRTRVIGGVQPAVNRTGEKIAFQRDGQILVSTGPHQTRIVYEPAWRKRSFVNGVSWSPDDDYISFGNVSGPTDMTTDFHLLEIDSGTLRGVDATYLRGLVIVPLLADS